MISEPLRQAVENLDGDYEIIREIGRGATAIVYLLRDRGLERDVALKLIRGGLGADEEAVARLQREAHLVAQLHHPNIVKLYSSQRLPDGSVALLMEHVPGRNLKEILRAEGALPIPRVLEVMKDVASALAYAHRRRIVHRDVKPENIYIDEEVGAARLADFGVARPWDQDSRLTVPGASLGTPAYMSPEQIDGKEVDGRSDVYSLGLVAYEMILGRHPWEGENVFTTIFKQKNEDLPLDLPGLARWPGLRKVLQWCLDKDREARWGSADILLKELQEVTPLRRKDDPVQWEILPEPPSTRRRAEEPVGPESERDIDWGTIDWAELDEKSPPVVDPSILQESLGAPLPAIPEEDADAEPSPIPTPGPSTATGEPWPRALRSPAVWIVLALILVTGGYGGYRWALGSGRGSGGPGGSPGESAEGTAGPGGASLLVLSGGDARLPVGSNARLAIRASTADGTPITDSVVTFRVLEGQGTLDATEVRTGAGGIAETTVRLPTQAGEVLVEGSLRGFDTPGARFRISVLPGAPARASRIIGDGQAALPGALLPDFIGVRVWDQYGNLIPDVPVRFRVLDGDGLVQPRETRTDDVGRAFARWTLGPIAGPQTLAAIIPGAPDSLLSFQATAGAPDNAPDTASEPTPVTAPDSAPGIQSPSPPPPAAPLRVRSHPFAIGGSYVCGIMGPTLACRGIMDRGQGGGETVAGLRALAAGVSHGCGLQADGTAWCWGANESGQLGDGTTRDRNSAVKVDTDTRFSTLVGGLSHSCGLSADGGAYCWGRNLNGQLGDGSRTDRPRPAPVTGGQTFETITAGWNHTCGLTASGRAFCWGLNGQGELGDGTRVDRLAPTRVPGIFSALAAGSGHTCGIRGSGVLCWGSNDFGQLGNGSEGGEQVNPTLVVGLPSPPQTLAAGAVHTCALLENGSVYCWGQNLHGQLGDGTNENSATPERVAGALHFTSLFAGGAVTCGFVEDGSEYCWGMNQGGQLGDGTRVNRSTPVRVREAPDEPQPSPNS